MHTIELAGRAVAVMGGSREEVEAFASDPAFQADLQCFEDESGQPLWDGSDAYAAFVREAWPEEVAVWERSFAKALAESDANPEDRDDWLTFLIKVRDNSGLEQ